MTILNPLPINAKCAEHLTKHLYKRGSMKGYAPVGPRYKNHFTLRALPAGGYAVRFHGTDILVVGVDDTITVHTSGWDSSPTTRAAIMDAFFTLTPHRVHVHSRRHSNVSQTYFTIRGSQGCVFFEGLTVTPSGAIPLPPSGKFPPLLAKRKDKEETRAFLSDPDVKAFREVLPILHAALAANGGPGPEQRMEARNWYWRQRPNQLDIAFARREDWPLIAAWFFSPDGHRATWRNIYAAVTKNMNKIVEIEE
jgi:hypothetical protein